MNIVDTPIVLPARPLTASTRAAHVLLLVAAALLAGALPLVMIVSNRSSALVLGLAGAAAGLACTLDGSIRALPRRWRAWASDPIAMAGLVFLAWAQVSLVWSAQPLNSASELYGSLLPLLASLVLAAALAGRAPAWTTTLLACALVVAMTALCVELLGHLPLSRLLGKRLDPADFNRPTLTLLILFWPLVGLLRARNRPLVAIAMVLLLLVTLAVSHSGTAVVAFAVSLLAYGAALMAPRASIVVAAGVIVVSFAVAPWIGDIAGHMVPETLATISRDVPAHGFHARERIVYWKRFATIVRRSPAFGWGFGASRWIASEPGVRVPTAPWLNPTNSHPHEMYLQVWVELGLVGVVLLGGLLLAGLHRLSRVARAVLPARFALVAAALCMGEFSHGAWQAWWIAALGAAVVLFAIADPRAPRLGDTAAPGP